MRRGAKHAGMSTYLSCCGLLFALFLAEDDREGWTADKQL
ncbi:hypothetical protein L284_13600 [Novosphingobium lindaniclasticum LE124]|uniref:Uncharacterized protein n=1 Tax=Novosphingobium lindaniclasticum LE124 TaxID=1096930 RepID=T0HP78_9SPHN|nr:hypothetical protein L284_13600 [Novosphingobium lindaniclasticum LE124]